MAPVKIRVKYTHVSYSNDSSLRTRHIEAPLLIEHCRSRKKRPLGIDAPAERGFLQKRKIGRTNYYVNVALNGIRIGADMGSGECLSAAKTRDMSVNRE
jgi:hypothetical protein